MQNAQCQKNHPKYLFLFLTNTIPFCMFICNPYLHRNRHDFQDGLPLIDFNGCAQPSFSAGNEVKNKRILSEPPVQLEGVYAALCPIQ